MRDGVLQVYINAKHQRSAYILPVKILSHNRLLWCDSSPKKVNRPSCQVISVTYDRRTRNAVFILR